VVAPISKASARQRAGRAGRIRPGKCYRLLFLPDSSCALLCKCCFAIPNFGTVLSELLFCHLYDYKVLLLFTQRRIRLKWFSSP